MILGLFVTAASSGSGRRSSYNTGANNPMPTGIMATLLAARFVPVSMRARSFDPVGQALVLNWQR